MLSHKYLLSRGRNVIHHCVGMLQQLNCCIHEITVESSLNCGWCGMLSHKYLLPRVHEKTVKSSLNCERCGMLSHKYLLPRGQNRIQYCVAMY
ncbi:hypothetical protein J6590_002998 [Homalodisca vitripennis]|nr:hypothetical protein J6590_002998 [Homalodisca vitripennis]